MPKEPFLMCVTSLLRSGKTMTGKEGKDCPPSHSFPFGPSWLISEQKVEGAGRINAFQDVKYEQSSAFRAALPLSGEDGAHSFHEIRNSGRVILPILRAG